MPADPVAAGARRVHHLHRVAHDHPGRHRRAALLPTSPPARRRIPSTPFPTVTSQHRQRDRDRGPRAGTLGLVKLADPLTYDSLGDVISYSYLLTNDRQRHPRRPRVAVSDDKVLVTCPASPTSLAPGASITCTASLTISQTDLDAGSVTNTASATALDADGDTVTSNTDSETATAVQIASVSLAKTSNATGTNVAGEVITYSYTVVNDGTVTITGFSSTDPHPGLGPITCAPTAQGGSLAPAASTTCTASYTVTQADVDAGFIANTGSVSGTTATAGPVSDTAPYTTPVAQSPALTIAKDADPTTVSAPGTITYTIVVTNTGNVSLTSPVLTDPFATTGPTLTGGDTDSDGVLDVGETWTYTASHTVTQAEIDAGTDLVNTATVDTDQTTPQTDTVVIPIAQTPALTIAKDADLTTVSAPGTITYTIVVANTGNVSLTSPVLTDPFATTGPTLTGGDTDSDGVLDVGETWTYTASHAVTQAEIDAGTALVNTASVDTDQTTPLTDDATTTVAQTPALTVDKTSTTTSVTTVGQVVPYSYTVTNTGNVTITGLALVRQQH